MNDMSMTKTRAEALAAFIASVRPDWQTPGIVTALAGARQRGDAWQVAIAAMRAAANPTNRTPAIIALDGKHWLPANPDEEPPKGTPTPTHVDGLRCTRCGFLVVHGEDHACGPRTEPTPEYRAAKAAIKNPPEESQP